MNTRNGRVRSALIVLLALLIGVTGARAAVDNRSSPDGTTVCAVADVHEVVDAFVAAFNAGDQEQLAGLVVSDPGFRWFSVSTHLNSGTTSFVAYSRPVFLRYARRRAKYGDRLTLLRLDVAGAARSSGYERGFTFELTRQADDIDAGQLVRYEGKGSLQCSGDGSAIAVWSMGTGESAPQLRAGTATDTWGRLRRPLSLFRLEPGSDCPRSYGRPGRSLSRDFGTAPALGEGPVYPIIATGAQDFTRETARTGVVSYARGRSEHGWHYVKVLWIESPRYRGPALVRGRQLDGSRMVRFEAGPEPQAELELWDPRAGYRRGWLNRPSEMRLRGPGCYGLQVDGKNFSRIIVFEAR